MNRALRAATMGVLLLSPVVLSACSAGQVTQTAGQERDKVGAMAEVGAITLRAVELTAPDGGSYDRGDDADLVLSISNRGTEDDALVEVSGDGFGDVEIDSGGTTGGDEIEIPAGGLVHVDGDEISITLTDLAESLTAGQMIEVTFTFETAGEVTVPVTPSTPDRDLPRGDSFDFHHEEGEEAAEGAE